MQSLKKFYFGKQKAKVNTYIGGIGGTINTPALLASKLGISVSRIKLFKVTGVDVECAIIGGGYQMPLSCWDGNTSITYWEDNVCTSTYFNVFRNASNMKYCIMNKVVTVSTGTSHIFDGCTSLKKILLPECTRFGGYYMLKNVPFDIFYGPKMITAFGDSVGNDSCFNINGTGKLILNTALQTCNAGAPDGDLQNAVTRGHQVIYVTNFTPPNTITNLSTGTIYNTEVQLNFTPPTSVNGVDFYEVYINGERFSTREIKNSGEFITGLTPSTNYNIRIVAVDMFYNKSELSNTVNVTTTNTVLDVDANAYMLASNNERWQPVINSLFTDLKSQGLYNKIQAFYPYLGTTAAQHKWNAKNPLDTNAAFRLQFFGGGTHSNLGYQCNGTDAYANTFLKHSNTNPLNNGFTIVFGTNNYKGATSYDFGGQGGAPNYYGYSVVLNNGAPSRKVQAQMNKYISGGTTGGNVEENNVSDIRGCITVTSIGLNLRKLYRNKLLKATQSTGAIDTVTSNFELFIGAINNAGSPFGYSNQRIQFAAIHEGLTDAEVVALHTIIDNFESAIGRKTW